MKRIDIIVKKLKINCVDTEDSALCRYLVQANFVRIKQTKAQDRIIRSCFGRCAFFCSLHFFNKAVV